MVQEASIMTDTAHSPNPFEVKIGNMVKWINRDTSSHRQTSGHAGEVENSIDSDILSEAQTFDIILKQPGSTHT
jgi:plastocyanin